MINDQTYGIYRKFDVTRINDYESKHQSCHYFVLDQTHDPHALPALRAYADSCREEYPNLAADLDHWVEELESRLTSQQARREADDSAQ